jgi:hypothetical protein
LSHVEVSAITDEWKLLSTDDIPEEWTKTESGDDVANVDHFWAKVFLLKDVKGDMKYKTLCKIVMAGLSLPHGSADVERGFSQNKKLVTADKVALCSGTIGACRLVKDAINNSAGGRAVNVHVTPALLKSARAAHSKYKEYLEKEKEKQAREKRQRLEKKLKKLADEKKKMEDAKRSEQQRKDAQLLLKEETDITVAEKEQRNVIASAGSLLKEAETKLSDAIKAGDLDKISVAHGLLEIARKRTSEATDELGKLSDRGKRCLEKRKRHHELVDGAEAKKAKNKE